MPDSLYNNTQVLQKVFLGVYRDFFNTCEVVVSAPLVFLWAGEYTVLNGAWALLQKVPLRVFVGIEGANDGQVRIESYCDFNVIKAKFETSEIDAVGKRRIEERIREIIKKERIETNGLNIRILAERPLEYGPTSPGAIGAALSAAVLLYANKVNYAKIVEWKNYAISQLIEDANLGFDKIFRYAWQIASTVHAHASSGAEAACSMLDSIYPILYFSERRFDHGSNEITADWPVTVAKDYFVLDKIKYNIIRLSEIADLSDDPFWPLDFCLINTGVSKKTDWTIRSTQGIRKNLNEVKEFFNPINDYLKRNNANVKLLLEDVKEDEFWSYVIKKQAVIAAEICYMFVKLLCGNDAGDTFRRFFRLINSHHDIFGYLDLTSPVIEKLRFSLLSNYDGGCKLSGGGRGGDVLLTTECGVLASSLDEKIKGIESELGQNFMIHYASWRDGLEKEGLRIEQILREGIQPEWVESDGEVITVYNGRESIKRSVTFTKLEELKQEADLFLDYRDKKIYIKGQMLTSDEIHSATGTLDIFKKLLSHWDEAVPAQELPESSYIDRNEMQSKIISPLKAAFKERTHKNLPLDISGRLASSFELTLKSAKNIKIITV